MTDSRADATFVNLTKAELATILVALRKWQRDTQTAGGVLPGPSSEWMEFFLEEWPLTADQIDQLCERLNLGGPHRVLIEIARGQCSAVYADDPSTEVIVYDYDEIAAGNPPPCNIRRTTRRMTKIL